MSNCRNQSFDLMNERKIRTGKVRVKKLQMIEKMFGAQKLAKNDPSAVKIYDQTKLIK